MPDKPRGIAADLVDAVTTATAKWTRQKKSEERHPGNVRYRVSRMTKEPRTSQKDAAWEIMEAAYLKASGGGRLPAKARQIFYAARPKIMELTDDKELQYKYFAQTLLPGYIEEHGVGWNVVFDARGHFQEPHTNRRIGCGTLEVRNYLGAVREPKIAGADFSPASVSVVGPSGGFAAVLFCEKEGFDPLFRAADLANRYDLMIISSKGQSVVSARQLIDDVCGGYGLPLFTLHDFDEAGFAIFAVLQRDTRRFQFSQSVEAVDLGLRLADIEGLEREPAAATKVKDRLRREQLAGNGASREETEILLTERIELNAMASDALIAMIERKLEGYGLKKVVPDHAVLAETYTAIHRSEKLRERFEDMIAEFDEDEAAEDSDEEAGGSGLAVPEDLKELVAFVLAEHPDLRWDDAVRVVLDDAQLDRVRADKAEARKKSGDFTGAEEEEGDDSD